MNISTGEKDDETHCRYCGQELYTEPGGHFECGGDGEGICSFWGTIGDYALAGHPAQLEDWLDDWIQEAVGMGWAEMGWDRAAHAAAIRDHYKLGATLPVS